MQSSQPKPKPQSTLAFTAVKIMGNNMGKAKMAVSVELLLVFAAIAEIKVRMPEIPKLPKSNTIEKSRLFSSGLLSKTVKNNQLIKAMRRINMALKRSFDNIIACGPQRL